MARAVFDEEVTAAIRVAQEAARIGEIATINVEGQERTIRQPFPSPGDWRDVWIYFLMIDRFNNPEAQPKHTWNRRYDFRQGGTFEGVRRQLGYLESLG